MSSNHSKMLSTYGLKWNPFQPGVPAETLYPRKDVSSFIWRVENLVMDGGIAMISGDPGYGKSVALRMIDGHLRGMRDLTVASIARAPSGLPDIYRELSDIFGVSFRVSNRYSGFQALRKKWRHHIESTLLRPVLLIDEAQSMQTIALSELRHLLSDEFDSKRILTVVLCGDLRLFERLKEQELLPIARRIRSQLVMGPLPDNEMKKMLEHALLSAGNQQLMSKGVIDTIVTHSLGNPSTMMNTSDELLARAMATEKMEINEKIFFELYEAPKTRPSKSGAPGRRS